MEILEVYPKDWYVRIEFSVTQVNYILDFLDKCEFHGDPKDPKMNDAQDYVIKQFFPQLNVLSDEMKKGAIDGT